MAQNAPGRHRTPGRHNPLNELKVIAKESAQPAVKGAAVLVASGGLIATFAQPASAAGQSTVAGTAKTAQAPAAQSPSAETQARGVAVVAPATAAAVRPASPAGVFGVKPARSTAHKNVSVVDVVAKRAADQRAAQQQTSRSATRVSVARTYSSSSTASSSSSSTAPAGTTGARTQRNWATPGQCTWGALKMWYASEGYYPAFMGNASSWGWAAANAGYAVGTTPRTRAFIVMQPGVYGSSSAGHVGWVTAVNGNQVTFVEMNAMAGAYNYNTRTVTNRGGIQYVYAP